MQRSRLMARNRAAVVLLLLLLGGDLFFIVLHFLGTLSPLFETPMLNLEAEGGYPEMYQYVKILLIVLTFMHIAREESCPPFLCWALLFLYFLLDDSLQLHERGGGYLAARLTFAPFWGLRLKDIGELLFSLGMSLPLFLLMVAAWKKGSGTFRRISLDIALLVVLLAFFGVAVDMVHMMVDYGWKTSFLLGVVEDGGEMASMSLILWYALRIRLQSPVYLTEAIGNLRLRLVTKSR